MIARLVLGEILEADQLDLFDRPAAAPPAQAHPQASAPETPAAPREDREWTIGSAAGYTPDELWAGKGIFVIVELPADPYSGRQGRAARRIAIAGSGGEGSYGPVGTKVRSIKVDTQGRGYRRLGSGTIVGYQPASNAGARAGRARAIYHFD